MNDNLEVGQYGECYFQTRESDITIRAYGTIIGIKKNSIKFIVSACIVEVPVERTRGGLSVSSFV